MTDLVARLARYPTERRFVGDVMSHAIVTCRPEAPRQAVLRSMVYRRSRSVVVVEGDRPVGVVTGRDALRLYEGSETPKEGSAGDFMRAPVITATPELPLRQAAERMLDHEIHRLVVVDRASGKGPLGVISTSDVVAEMSAEGSVWQPDATVRR